MNTGQAFHYMIRGVFKPGNRTSKLLLTGTGAMSSGSALQVGMSANQVSNIKGKISGQAVNVSF